MTPIHPGNLISVVCKQWLAERSLRRRGIAFRSTDPARVAEAYSRMSGDEFDAINLRQDWCNWRTIPRSLQGRLPDRPVTVLDLGCGTGSSTRVLAWHCPPGSCIVGYEFAAPLLEVARQRAYLTANGQPARVAFVCGSVTAELRQPDGRDWPDGSIDWVSSSGVIGHHLTPETIRPLIVQLQRLIRPQGFAALDPGPTLPALALTRALSDGGFRRVGRSRSCWLDVQGQILFQRQDDKHDPGGAT